MKYVIFNFHEPYRIREFSVFEIGHRMDYFSDNQWRQNFNFEKVREGFEKKYIPKLNKMSGILENSKVRVGVFFSGVFLEQMSNYCPEFISMFRELLESGRVSIFSRPYYDFYGKSYVASEKRRQEELHAKIVNNLFDIFPVRLVNEGGYDFEVYFENDLQRRAYEEVCSLGEVVLSSGDDELVSSWRNMFDSSHFELMSFSNFHNNEYSKYGSFFESPYEVFISYMNILKSLGFESEKKKRRISPTTFIK